MLQWNPQPLLLAPVRKRQSESRWVRVQRVPRLSNAACRRGVLSLAPMLVEKTLNKWGRGSGRRQWTGMSSERLLRARHALLCTEAGRGSASSPRPVNLGMLLNECASVVSPVPLRQCGEQKRSCASIALVNASHMGSFHICHGQSDHFVPQMEPLHCPLYRGGCKSSGSVRFARGQNLGSVTPS